MTSTDVFAAVKNLRDKDAGARADAARRLVLLTVKAKTPALVEAGPFYLPSGLINSPLTNDREHNGARDASRGR